MMFKIFDRYIIKMLLAHYAGATGVILGVFIVVDTLYHIDTLSKAGGGLLKALLLYWASALPQVFVMLAPVAFIVASVSVLTLLKRRNELTAFICAGASVWRLLAPFFVVSAVSALLMLLVDATLLEKGSSVWRALRTDRAVKRLTFRDRNYVVRIDRFTPATNSLKRVHLLFLDERGYLTERVTAEEGWLRGGRFELKNCSVSRYDSYGRPVVVGERRDVLSVPTSLVPEDFEALEQDLQSLSLSEMASLMRKKPHLPHIRLNFYARIALVMANFVLLVVCIPFTLGMLGRSGFLNFGVVLVICFTYFLVSLFFWQLGSTGQMAPVSAAWLPNILFICLGAVIIDITPN